jgi:hypothetical protein
MRLAASGTPAAVKRKAAEPVNKVKVLPVKNANDRLVDTLLRFLGSKMRIIANATLLKKLTGRIGHVTFSMHNP